MRQSLLLEDLKVGMYVHTSSIDDVTKALPSTSNETGEARNGSLLGEAGSGCQEAYWYTILIGTISGIAALTRVS